MKRIVVYGLFFFVCFQIGNAQETTIKSVTNEETADETTQFIRYTVKAGDTKYSLAKRFGIEIITLQNQNPQIVPMLKVGEVLQIDLDGNQSNSFQNNHFYIVKTGDTKFGLSQKFGVSIEQLEAWNPHIVQTLMIGQRLTLSGSTPVPTEIVIDTSVASRDDSQNNQTEQQTNEYVSYTIQPGETLYGLSKSAGMIIEAFLDLNPELATSVQAGMIIKMPSENKKSTSNYTDLRQTLIKNKRKNLTFFLPFSETDFISDLINRDNLSAYLEDNRDFYRGALIAMDSVRSLGLNFDFDIVNLDTAKLSPEAIAKNATINSSDAIIVPYYQKNFQEFTAHLALDNIPVITVSSLSETPGSPNLFEAVPSINAQRKTMLDYLSSRKDGNLVVINDENRSESRDFIIANIPEAKFVQVKANGTFDSEDLVKMLQKNSKNYVILDTDKNGVFISATNALLRELSNYQIQLVVLESSLIPDEDDVSRKRFVILNMLYPSFSKVNSHTQRIFRKHYMKRYSSQPVTMSAYGFDITFDTLLRLFQPESFEMVSKKITEYNILKFQYSKNEMGYYSNFGVSIFKYETHDIHKQVN